MMVNRDDLDDPYESVEEDDMFSQRERVAGERRRSPRVVPDFLKRAIENTMGSMQNTGSMSREALSYLLQQGDRGKKEVVRIVAQEVGMFLKNVDLSSEIIKVLTAVQLEVNASVKFKPTKDGGIKPEITHNTEVMPSPDLPHEEEISRPPEPARDPKDG
jgi:hypothetical protein